MKNIVFLENIYDFAEMEMVIKTWPPQCELVSDQSKSELPDRIFHKFSAAKSVDRRILCCRKCRLKDSDGPFIV